MSSDTSSVQPKPVPVPPPAPAPRQLIGLGDKAVELIKELQRNANKVPMYNTDGVRKVLEEINALSDANHKDATATIAGASGLYSSIEIRHASVERNKRCLLAYHHERLQRLRTHRWVNGSVLSSKERSTLSNDEVDWFHGYNTALTKFMCSLGGEEGEGCDLTTDQLAPRPVVHVKVVCVQNYGELQTSDGNSVMLTVDTTHSLRRVDCEHLIRQGILQEII